jgi:hypothetical protein
MFVDPKAKEDAGATVDATTSGASDDVSLRTLSGVSGLSLAGTVLARLLENLCEELNLSLGVNVFVALYMADLSLRGLVALKALLCTRCFVKVPSMDLLKPLVPTPNLLLDWNLSDVEK